MKTKIKSTLLKTLLIITAFAFIFALFGIVSTPSVNTVKASGEVSLTMTDGAQIRTLSPMGLKFSATINNYDADDTTKSYGMLIVPNSYLTDNNITSDYINALNTAGKTTLATMWCTPQESSGVWTISGALADVLETNYNREFFGIAYIYDNVTETYTYASFNSGENIRSISYVADCVINDTSTSYSETVTTYLKNVAASRLAYTLNESGLNYSVTGIGNFTGTDITIPSSYMGKPVTKIGASAFSSNTSLTSVTMPNSITAIGESAFDGCTGLTGVYITDLEAWCGIEFGDHKANPGSVKSFV